MSSIDDHTTQQDHSEGLQSEQDEPIDNSPISESSTTNSPAINQQNEEEEILTSIPTLLDSSIKTRTKMLQELQEISINLSNIYYLIIQLWMKKVFLLLLTHYSLLYLFTKTTEADICVGLCF